MKWFISLILPSFFHQATRFACFLVSSLQGSSVLVCDNSGTWSSLPPDCEIVSCGLPPTIKDATFSGSNFTFGNSVTYTCKEGYVTEHHWIGSIQQVLKEGSLCDLTIRFSVFSVSQT